MAGKASLSSFPIKDTRLIRLRPSRSSTSAFGREWDGFRPRLAGISCLFQHSVQSGGETLGGPMSSNRIPRASFRRTPVDSHIDQRISIRRSLGDDVDPACRRQAHRSAGCRSRNLELLDRFLREIQGRCSDVFNHRVNTVDGDARFPSRALPNRDACVASFGGIKGAALVDFDSRMQARSAGRSRLR